MKKYNYLGKRHFEVLESIFKLKVYVFLNWSDEDFEKFAHKKGATDYKATKGRNFTAFSTEMESKNGTTEWVIVLHTFDWTICHQGTLIHEIVHTIVKMWKLNNIPVVPENQEFFAHAVSQLYEDIAAKIHHLKKKKK